MTVPWCSVSFAIYYIFSGCLWYWECLWWQKLSVNMISSISFLNTVLYLIILFPIDCILNFSKWSYIFYVLGSFISMLIMLWHFCKGKGSFCIANNYSGGKEEQNWKPVRLHLRKVEILLELDHCLALSPGENTK